MSVVCFTTRRRSMAARSEEHTSELQSHSDLVCRLLLEKKKSVNDRRVILISQFLIENCAARSAAQLSDVLSSSLTHLDLAAMRLLESQSAQSTKQAKRY